TISRIRTTSASHCSERIHFTITRGSLCFGTCTFPLAKHEIAPSRFPPVCGSGASVRSSSRRDAGTSGYCGPPGESWTTSSSTTLHFAGLHGFFPASPLTYSKTAVLSFWLVAVFHSVDSARLISAPFLFSSLISYT